MKTFEVPQLMELGIEFTAEGVLAEVELLFRIHPAHGLMTITTMVDLIQTSEYTSRIH